MKEKDGGFRYSIENKKPSPCAQLKESTDSNPKRGRLSVGIIHDVTVVSRFGLENILLQQVQAFGQGRMRVHVVTSADMLIWKILLEKSNL